MIGATTEETLGYRVEIRPDTRLGLLLRERPCLKVVVIRSSPWQFVGIEQTRNRDQDEARALAARMISEWERNHSEVVL